MGIARFENISVNNLTFGASAFGEQSTTETLWFVTRARVSTVGNSLTFSEHYRLYQNLTNFTLNYTPNTKLMVDDQNLYSITWRGKAWRIDNIKESDDRMTVLILCYRSDPVTSV